MNIIDAQTGGAVENKCILTGLQIYHAMVHKPLVMHSLLVTSSLLQVMPKPLVMCSLLLVMCKKAKFFFNQIHLCRPCALLVDMNCPPCSIHRQPDEGEPDSQTVGGQAS